MPAQARLFAVRAHPAPTVPIEDAMRAAGLPPFEREVRFDGARRWRFDYAWPAWRIAFEVEGDAFGRLIVVERGHERRRGQSIPLKPGTRIRVGGRHNSGAGMSSDIEKYNRAAVLGWLVVRATTTMIRDGEAITALRHAFGARGLE